MKPLPLVELQSAFKQYVLVGDNEAELSVQVARREGISAETRLEVYRNAYYTRLQESLAHDFPVLLAVAGDKAFGRLATAYVRDHPSTKPSLRWLGQHLPHWLRSTANEAPLADLAALEWAVLHAFDAHDAMALTPADLAAIPADRWPNLRLTLHPSVTILTLQANVREIWLAVRGGRPLPALRLISQEVVVWRSQDGPQVEAVSSGCYVLLGALMRGSRLSEACEVLAQSTQPVAVPTAVAEYLHYALSRGWFAPSAA